MQTFNTADARHWFVIDGREYFLPPVTITDSIEFGEMNTDDAQHLAESMRALLLSRARPAKRTMWEALTGGNPAVKAIKGLGIKQVSAIFTAWATSMLKLDLGESSGSAE